MMWAVILIFISGIIFYFYCLNWQAWPWPNPSLKIPSFQVHRGYWREGIRENTLSAFAEAKRRGALMIELDTMASLGGAPVVYHDFDLQRLHGRPEKVSALSLGQMQELAGAPSLEEVLLSPEVPQWINIEIKSTDLVDRGFEKQISQVLLRCQQQQRVLFSSFNPHALRRIAKLLPEVPRALLVTTAKGDEDAKLHLRKMWLGYYARAHMVNLDARMITPELMQVLTKRNIPVAVWTVNDKAKATQLRDLGVLSIITDLEQI